MVDVAKAMIDVLVPAFNSEKTIESSIDSILGQTIGDIRIIVINDGSTDRTGNVLTSIQARDRRVNVLTVPNGGIVTALNVALSHSTADFIARHDADDIAYPNRFERQIRYLRQHPDCIAVGSNAVIIDELDQPTRRTNYYGDVTGDPTQIPAREPYILHPFLMMRAQALRAADGYRHVLHAEDTDLYWRLLGQGRLYNLKDELGCYRIHSNSLTSGSVQNGRVGSVYSTLSAVSYQRLSSGRSDLHFSARALKAVKTLNTIPEIIAYAGRDLTPTELTYVQAASAAKLLQNATYRAWLLEKADCCFIRSQLKNIRMGTDGKHWREIRIDLTVVLLRLLKAGRYVEARALQSSIRDYLPLARLAIRTARVWIRSG
ncbi:MAG: glycosyltransferase family 2 protein [Oxalobacteraceae bacterium]|nr:MAG: glycosyltransferase family 2 protein [Oxalobacteraceae bacterium]